MTAVLYVAYRTDPGRRRSENQDAILVHSLAKDDDTAAHLLAVADGVGGGPGGRLASERAVLSLRESATGPQDDDPAEGLRKGFHLANEHVMQIAIERPELAGMASTLTAALIHKGQVWLANVGDSRVYLVRANNAWPLTYDHSWVAEQVEAGKMTADEAAADPRRNMITRAIGVETSVEPDLYEAVALEDGDSLVLCSDGLYGLVNDAEIASIISEIEPDEAVDKLVDLANERGGPDNISVVIARWNADGVPPPAEDATLKL